MKARHWAMALPLAGMLFTPAFAKADGAFYATAETAEAACANDTVVWIDLDRSRYYHKGQENYAKNANGVYACEKTAHAKYREAKSDTSAVATK